MKRGLKWLIFLTVLILATILIFNSFFPIRGHNPAGDVCAGDSDCKCTLPFFTFGVCGGLDAHWACVANVCENILKYAICNGEQDCLGIATINGVKCVNEQYASGLYDTSRAETYKSICKCEARRCSPKRLYGISCTGEPLRCSLA